MAKTIYIGVVVLMVIALIGYGIWIYVTAKNRTGFFKDYEPVLGDGLTIPVPIDRTPLTPEQQAIKDELIKAALEKAAAKANR